MPNFCLKALLSSRTWLPIFWVFGVSLLQPCLFLLAQSHAVALKLLIVLLEYHLLLACETGLVTLVELCDALVESLVEGEVVAVLCHHGYGQFHHAVQCVCSVGLTHVVEHSRHLAQDFSREFQRQDSVVEGGSIRVVDDVLYLLLLLFYARLYGRDVVVNLNLLEWRDAIRCVPIREERILAVGAGREACCCNHSGE